MRKQYYFRPSERGLLAWDVDRLTAASAALPRKQVALASIRELHEPWCGDGESPRWCSMIEHLHLIEEADLSYPIILSADGSVMDGMHRVVKATLRGLREIDAVLFADDPEPDYVGRGPGDLPY